mmetsp:Transcript_14679/g.52827  ORF Transcript_14679/g.52827 Transcript_14679/m.52827 type:complete len:451 (+) Transcript_14679:1047-2399(+)|eukprot:30447-Pelagococcus_subviridis.AAC.1
MHGESARVRRGVAAVHGGGDLDERREALPRVLRLEPERAVRVVGAQRIARGRLDAIQPRLHPLASLVQRELIHPAGGVEVRGLHVQPVQPVLAERARLLEEKRAAAHVAPDVIQVRVHRVRAPAEVDVVREKDLLLVAHLLRDFQLNQKVAPLRVQLSVLALHADLRVDVLSLVLSRDLRGGVQRVVVPSKAIPRVRPHRLVYRPPRRHARDPAAVVPDFLHDVHRPLVHDPRRLSQHVQRVQHGLIARAFSVAVRPLLFAQERHDLPPRRPQPRVVPAHDERLRAQVPALIEPAPRPRRRDHRHVSHQAHLRVPHVLVLDVVEERGVPGYHPVPLLPVYVLVVVLERGLDLELAALGIRHLDLRGLDEELREDAPELHARGHPPVRVVQRPPREFRDGSHRRELTQRLRADLREAIREMRLGEELVDVAGVLGQIPDARGLLPESPLSL